MKRATVGDRVRLMCPEIEGIVYGVHRPENALRWLDVELDQEHPTDGRMIHKPESFFEVLARERLSA